MEGEAFREFIPRRLIDGGLLNNTVICVKGVRAVAVDAPVQIG